MELRRILLRPPQLKPQFGPTLPELLAPRMANLPRIVKRVVAVLVAIVVAIVIVVVLRSQDPVFTHNGPPASFTTSYSRAFTREPVSGNVLLKLIQNSSVGLEASFEIQTLRLPRYGGEISGLLPVVASVMIARMQASDPSFIPWSRGRTRINKIPGYTFTFQRTIDGRRFWGRDVLITPHLQGDRSGLLMTMLTDPQPLLPIATKPVTPDSVGSVGILFEPYERLRFH